MGPDPLYVWKKERLYKKADEPISEIICKKLIFFATMKFKQLKVIVPLGYPLWPSNTPVRVEATFRLIGCKIHDIRRGQLNPCQGLFGPV